MAALTKTNRRSAINTFKLKPALAAIRSFSKSENDQITAIDQAIDAGLRSEWLAPSEVQFARNKEADPTIPVKWKDWQQAMLHTMGDEAFRLVNSDVKALSDDDKAKRTRYKRDQQQYMTRFISKLKAEEKRREALAAGEDAPKRQARPILERLNEHADKAKGILEKEAQAEAPQLTAEDRKAWAAWIAAKPKG